MFVGRRRCLIFLIYHGVSFTGIRTHSPVQRMSCDSLVTPRPAVLGPTTDRLIACEQVPDEPRDLRIVVGVCASPGADAATAAQPALPHPYGACNADDRSPWGPHLSEVPRWAPKSRALGSYSWGVEHTPHPFVPLSDCIVGDIPQL